MKKNTKLKEQSQNKPPINFDKIIINTLLTESKKGTPVESYYAEIKRNIVVIRNKKKTKNGYKNYYSYQLNLPLNLLQMYEIDSVQQPIYNTYLIEKNKQRYVIKFSTSEIEDAIKINLPVDSTHRNISLTLPKKQMEYLQAYDTYQDVVQIINQEIEQKDDEKIKPFKVQPLYAVISIFTNIAEEILVDTDGIEKPYLRNVIDEISISIETHIDDRFIEYAKKDNANMDVLPGWLATLKIDWQHEKFNEIFDIDSNVNKWKY